MMYGVSTGSMHIMWCTQVREFPQIHCGYKQEGTLYDKLKEGCIQEKLSFVSLSANMENKLSTYFFHLRNP